MTIDLPITDVAIFRRARSVVDHEGKNKKISQLFCNNRLEIS